MAMFNPFAGRFIALQLYTSGDLFERVPLAKKPTADAFGGLVFGGIHRGQVWLE
jgi:hypothetical protein